MERKPGFFKIMMVFFRRASCTLDGDFIGTDTPNDDITIIGISLK